MPTQPLSLRSEMVSGNIAGSSFDAVIIGGGAGGSAAAITIAAAGLASIIIEASPSPRQRPGEALHPGVESLFSQLGVIDDIGPSLAVRHSGIYTMTPEGAVFRGFGQDKSGAWRGYQIGRAELDAILLKRALAAGCTILRPARASGLERSDEGWRVATPEGPVFARFLVDASGSGHWLARRLGFPITRLSPQLIAQYGYYPAGEQPSPGRPLFTSHPGGWTWEALVKPGVLQWVGLPLEKNVDLPAPAGIELKGADVTWRAVQSCADENYFLVGDAAAVLDPACSHGVLRALMSGMYAGTLIAAMIGNKVPVEAAASIYRSWFLGWVCRDALELVHRYAAMTTPASWLQAAVETCSVIAAGLRPLQDTTPS